MRRLTNQNYYRFNVTINWKDSYIYVVLMKRLKNGTLGQPRYQAVIMKIDEHCDSASVFNFNGYPISENAQAFEILNRYLHEDYSFVDIKELK